LAPVNAIPSVLDDLSPLLLETVLAVAQSRGENSKQSPYISKETQFILKIVEPQIRGQAADDNSAGIVHRL
jgi:hypothetical protein